MRRAAAGSLATMGVAAAVAATTAVPASAADQCLEIEVATACFESYGDTFALSDTQVDGLTPMLQWETDYGRSGEFVFSGSNTWEVRDYDLAERYNVNFRILLIDADGDVVDGTSWVGTPIGG
ncbi:hypothetical protein EXU48_13440 [Occultella glacieicola]|uniref:Uncharacterized protein n=1 Tax=Occultella glacieicola TaxID=2518684 RepID=A0ABY2E228_9MICO|nr:hypothetical protein [Occultella glacieicola]TDE92546.1 hypothetical protein EXU48_13440 [Occultella glacieicola]